MATQDKTDKTNIDVNTPYTPKKPVPLVSISVNHPFATAFRKLKNFLIHKQTLFSTTFSIKITPIVAIVSLFGVATLFGGGLTTAFNFGKTFEQKLLASVPTPTPKVIIKKSTVVIVSRAGVVQATYQLPKGEALGESDSSSSASAATLPTPTITPVPTVKPTPTPTVPVLHYILVSRSGSILFLISQGAVRLQNYVGRRVIVTGSLDTTKNTLTVAKPDDIELLQ